MEVCLAGFPAVDDDAAFRGPDADAGSLRSVAADDEPEFLGCARRDGEFDALDAAGCTVQDVLALGYFDCREAE